MQKKEQPKLSYAEALTIYNQELAALDRLLAQRDALREQPQDGQLDLAEQLLGDVANVEAGLSEALGDLGLETNNGDEGTETEPSQIEKMQERIDEIQAGRAERDGEIARQLAELDEEIAKQQERVARAKADRDAAATARDDAPRE